MARKLSIHRRLEEPPRVLPDSFQVYSRCVKQGYPHAYIRVHTRHLAPLALALLQLSDRGKLYVTSDRI